MGREPPYKDDDGDDDDDDYHYCSIPLPHDYALNQTDINRVSSGVKRVHVDGVLSSQFPVSRLVGSLPLPTLGINNLPEVVNSNTTFALCADVAKRSRVITNLSDIETLQSDLNSLYDWTVLWGLSFNVKKMKF